MEESLLRSGYLQNACQPETLSALQTYDEKTKIKELTSCTCVKHRELMSHRQRWNPTGNYTWPLTSRGVLLQTLLSISFDAANRRQQEKYCSTVASNIYVSWDCAWCMPVSLFSDSVLSTAWLGCLSVPFQLKLNFARFASYTSLLNFRGYWNLRCTTY